MSSTFTRFHAGRFRDQIANLLLHLQSFLFWQSLDPLCWAWASRHIHLEAPPRPTWSTQYSKLLHQMKKSQHLLFLSFAKSE